jgi:hypothetical protein
MGEGWQEIHPHPINFLEKTRSGWTYGFFIKGQPGVVPGLTLLQARASM